MKRQLVESSNLASIGYDPINQILEVEFKKGGIYQYFEVQESVFEELMNADSHGVYFSSNSRNEYEFSKV